MTLTFAIVQEICQNNQTVKQGKESLNDMAVEARRKGLQIAKVEPDDVDLVLLCTSTLNIYGRCYAFVLIFIYCFVIIFLLMVWVRLLSTFILFYFILLDLNEYHHHNCCKE